jgi:RNA polymerase sigma-70 factor (ECF subfamily)
MSVVAELREVRRAIGGDAGARDRVVQGLYDRLRRYLVKLSRDRAVADELAQETALRLLRSFDRLREPARLEPWAFRIATNAWRDHVRAQSPRPLPPERREPERADPELAGRVMKALDALPDPYRTALVLRFLEGMDYEQMAEILDVEAVTLRSHVARGRALIRRTLEGEGFP